MLRALVVLPSRDLATQVYRVFEEYVVGSSFTVGLAIGQSDFVAEQKALTVNESTRPLSDDVDMLSNRLQYDPGNLSLALQLSRHRRRHQSASAGTESPSSHRMRVPANGWSNVDILVATPGRLVDHLDKTVGFTLQHLRFLVVDEADRLLSQSYHNWIDRVLDAATAESVSRWKSTMFGCHGNGDGVKNGSVNRTSNARMVPPFQLAAN
jgi:ATP-dependent RNA helicase DDX51/DBP6